jgi:hypothetical protein
MIALLQVVPTVIDSVATNPEVAVSIPAWITVLLSAIIVVLGFLGIRIPVLLKQLNTKIDIVTVETKQLVDSVGMAVSDGKVTNEELQTVIKEAKDIIKAIKN